MDPIIKIDLNLIILLGRTFTSLLGCIQILLLIKYLFIDKSTTLTVNVYSTLTDHYYNALKTSPDEVRQYFLKTFPIKETEIIPNEFISEKRKNIIAEISLTEPNTLAIIIGSDDYDIKILNIYDKKNNKINPIRVHEREDIPTKNQKEINKGQLYIHKGKYVALLTQAFGSEAEQKVELKINGHKILIDLTTDQKHGAKKYIQAKNTLKSYINKLASK